MTINLALRAELERRGISQGEAAREMGVHPNRLSRWISQGRRAHARRSRAPEDLPAALAGRLRIMPGRYAERGPGPVPVVHQGFVSMMSKLAALNWAKPLTCT